MNDQNPLHTLNDAQREAVCAPIQPVLILAGAGSGKTRVLVQRIAWLIASHHIKPYNILAVTFTNKAAHEMRERIETLLQCRVGEMWMGTFHGLAHRMLRRHYAEAGLVQNFQILDADDQLRLLKRIINELGLDEKTCPPRKAQWFINAQKDEGHRAAQVQQAFNNAPSESVLLQIYATYERACERAGVVDFAELLLRCLELLQKQPMLLTQYRQRFAHVLVDEFQDTNRIQYQWLQLIAGSHTPIFAVGDDDQSIYGWRGARVEHILRFNQDYPHAQIIRLEQNYRSTANILQAANALIMQNETRLGKQLWTQSSAGEPLYVYAAFNEEDEAEYVVGEIINWHQAGHPYAHSAILYRSNAQSRLFEQILLRRRIPYRIYGGLRFFERAEIKDALAYLRLLVQPQDDTAFLRIINHPPRGMGERSLQKVREYAQEHDLSLYQAAEALTSHRIQLTPRAANAMRGFAMLLQGLQRDSKDLKLHEQVALAIERSGLMEYHALDKGEKGQGRVDNLKELINAAYGFGIQLASYADELYAEMTPLQAFLSSTVLDTGEAEGAVNTDSVQLMTLHSAKGLEFPIVFICGLEEKLFPHSRSIDTPNEQGVEEERRLAYVGITRAQKQLYLSYARRRYVFGTSQDTLPSRFLDELPQELLHVANSQPQLRQNRINAFAPPPARVWQDKRTPSKHASFGSATSLAAATEKSAHGFHIGERVWHDKFGEGVIVRFEVQSKSVRAEIHFSTCGRKLLDLSIAKLTKCE